tara:strand:+ start:1236 stop:1856 length:621 start_codon:yes stop_codon:yes gene_type:complete
MTTFATLKTDISSYMARSDLTESLKNTFVRIAEAEIRRKVRIGQMETTNTSFSVSSQTTALPTGFVSMRAVTNNTQNQREMEYMSPVRLRSSRIFDEGTGEPSVYTIEGDNIVIAPTPSSGSLTIVYYKAFDALSADTDTNWLLANGYDVYLYGSLRAASEWAMEPDTENQYAIKFERAVEQINREDRWGRVSGSGLVRTGGGGTP